MSVIRRLPRYYRFLSYLDNQETQRISSKKLADIMNVTASQVRQDLNCFGGFGQQGYGYSVKQLKLEIGEILGLNRQFKAIIIGAGNLGTAVAKHMHFEARGFELVGIFDKNPDLAGQILRGIEIRPDEEIESFCDSHTIDAAILCMPRNGVELVIERLYSKGIKSYWNFSHYDIASEYKDTIVENVHMSDSLMTLCYRMNQR